MKLGGAICPALAMRQWTGFRLSSLPAWTVYDEDQTRKATAAGWESKYKKTPATNDDQQIR